MRGKGGGKDNSAQRVDFSEVTLKVCIFCGFGFKKVYFFGGE